MTPKPRLIGILGGMGPKAGLDMANRLVDMARAKTDQDHLPFVLFSMPTSIPDRTSFLLGKTDTNPAFEIAEQLRKMSELGVSTAVVACNTAHSKPIFDIVVRLLESGGIELRVLHLVEETVSYILKNHPDIRNVGVLGTEGTYRSQLYDIALSTAGLIPVTPQSDVQDDIQTAIYSQVFGIKTLAGVVTDSAKTRIKSAILHLSELGAQAIVLGCTELPLAITCDLIGNIPILDPAKIIVEKLIQEASIPNTL